jgi:hypothetical protein
MDLPFIIKVIGPLRIDSPGKIEYFYGKSLLECMEFITQWDWCDELKEHYICSHYGAVSRVPQDGISVKNPSCDDLHMTNLPVYDDLYVFRIDGRHFERDIATEYTCIKECSAQHSSTGCTALRPIKALILKRQMK